MDLTGELLALLVGAAGGFFATRFTRNSSQPRAPDVAEKRTEQQRDDSLEQIVGLMPVAALVVDRNGYLKFANAIAESAFEMDAERGRGRALIEAIGSVDLERLVRRGQAGGRAEGMIVLRSVESERSLVVTVQRLEKRAGDILVFAEDRSKVADADRVRRDFLADVSHELRTPISSIRLMVETIQLSGDDPEAIRLFLPKMVEELERMTRLIEDLLELARGEAGQVPLHLSKIELSRLVEDTVAAFQSRAQELEVNLRLDAPRTIEADVDAKRLTQVIVNLIDNALRHTASGGHVLVGVGADNGEAFLSVKDDGVGIPFKDLPHVFERFYVVDRSRSRGSGGTGLGLAIVKQIIEAHGGSVHVDSELGLGARFSCRLPILDEV
ncbi:MAG: ATP-binding protein [Vulcanimicrobiaceae bacterium]|jgi:two-component system phosphate regulon sensor histidine kinase PhoR